MRVLIVKTSSMGDVIHTLPALTDACLALPGIEFDWVVEPAFAEIPRWHKAVRSVISVPLRRLRKTPWTAWRHGEWQAVGASVRATSYDHIIDAQGLMKSALLAKWAKCAKGQRAGYAWESAREPFATLLYERRLSVPKGLHAVEKIRALFAQVFAYPVPNTPPDYGIDVNRLTKYVDLDNIDKNKSIVFLHGTTWDTKHWPQVYWERLSTLASQAGFRVLLPWGNETEYQRAQAIQAFSRLQVPTGVPAIVLPKLNLAQLSTLIAQSKAVVTVDTGLGHIAAAMAVPTISLYGPTDPGLTGAYGPNQRHLTVQMDCAPCLGRTCKKGTDFQIQPPCFETLNPARVWQELLNIMG